MSIKHVVFDWDGTLVDTVPVLKKAYEYTFKSMKLPEVSYAKIRELAGQRSDKTLFQKVFGDEAAEPAKKVLYGFIKAHHLALLKPIKGAEDILRYCNEHNIKCHILTKKNRPFLDDEMNLLGWEQYFDRVIGSGELKHDKPHPDACAALFQGQPPPTREMLVLGDGDSDVVMARVWGCQAVILDSQNTYKGPQADYIIRALPEFTNIVENINNRDKKLLLIKSANYAR